MRARASEWHNWSGIASNRLLGLITARDLPQPGARVSAFLNAGDRFDSAGCITGCKAVELYMTRPALRNSVRRLAVLISALLAVMGAWPTPGLLGNSEPATEVVRKRLRTRRNG